MMMASIVTLPVLVFTMCLALLPIALLVVLQVFLCRKSRKLGLILPVLSLVLSFVLTSVALINCVTPAAAATMTTVDENGQMVEEVIPQPDFYPPPGERSPPWWPCFSPATSPRRPLAASGSITRTATTFRTACGG